MYQVKHSRTVISSHEDLDQAVIGFGTTVTPYSLTPDAKQQFLEANGPLIKQIVNETGMFRWSQFRLVKVK